MNIKKKLVIKASAQTFTLQVSGLVQLSFTLILQG